MSEEAVVDQGNTDATNVADDTTTQSTDATQEGQQEGSQSTETEQTQSTETTDEAENAEGDQQPEGAPESYELEIPEGMQVDEKLMGSFEAMAREANLTNDQANAFAKMYAERMTEMVDAQAAAWEKQKSDWVGELKNDSDFGGQAFTENVQVARSAIARFGGEDLATAMKDLGIDNHPATVKAWLAVGKAISEDSAIQPVVTGEPKGAQSLYPNSKMNP